MPWYAFDLLSQATANPATAALSSRPAWSYLIDLAIAVAVIVASIGLASFLAKHWRMPEYFTKFAVVLFSCFAGVAVCLWAVYTQFYAPPDLRHDKIKLGIDLAGGVILVYEIQSDQFLTATNNSPQDVNPDTGQTRKGPRDVNMDQLISVISKRINPGGVMEITVRKVGAKSIEIIIPRVEEAEVQRIKRIISKSGSLEFRILATRQDPEMARLIDKAQLLKDNEMELFQDGQRRAYFIPIETEKMGRLVDDPNFLKRVVTRKGKPQVQVLVYDDPEDVTGAYLTRAYKGMDEKGGYAVHFRFGSEGAAKFGRLTTRYQPSTMAAFKYHLGIVLDGTLQSAPTINSPITSEGQISGDFSEQEVDDLVGVLNAGALPAALNPAPISEQYIGPTLGKDTIDKGLFSLAISMVLVFAFVLVYYRFAGIVACMALLMNAVLLLGIMIMIQAAFTLPGLAGFALTIGMAVDANVLIYERMREEAHRGAALRMVIRNGFDRALSAIVDSNLTTLITAVVLWVIGTDQVRGFAVTLFLGILLSMFTAIFCARVVFDVAERRRWISTVNMMQAIGETRFNFFRYKWTMIGISGVVILIGLAATLVRGRGLLDIDFTGGVSVQTVFNDPQNIVNLRGELEKHPELTDVVVSDVQLPGNLKNTQFIINTSTPEGKTADQYLTEVKEKLSTIFASGLARNEMKITEAEGPAKPAIPAAPEKADAKGPAKPEAESPAKPKTDGKTSYAPTPGRPEATALATLMFAADGKEAPKPEAKQEAKAEAKPEAKPEAKAAAPTEPPKPPVEAEKPAAKPEMKPEAKEPAKPNTRTVRMRLDFRFPINHDALDYEVQQAKGKVLQPGQTLDYSLLNPLYEDGSALPLQDWTFEATLPADASDHVVGQLLDALKKQIEGQAYYPSSNTIGGAVAEATRWRAVYALLASTVFILLYLWVRFQRISYGLGAVVALVHDVAVALGFVALSYFLVGIPVLGALFNAMLLDPFKVNLTIVTALLTIAGYSLNDTIVIFDRIREVRGKASEVTEGMINTSINQTLGRTLLTGLTSIMVIIILYLIGGPAIHGFAFAMLIGVVTGTYSSIYIASPFLLWISKGDEKRR
jgi:SecD/SecF fusion protein